MTSLPEVAPHQKQSVSFAHVRQRYLASLTSLPARRGEQQQWHSERAENREPAIASAQKFVIQWRQFADTPCTEPRADDGGHRPQHEPTGIPAPTHIRKRLFAHIADNSPRSRLLDRVHEIPTFASVTPRRKSARGFSTWRHARRVGGRGRYRTADRWCVNPSRTVHGVSRGAVASWNAQFSGWFVSHSVRGVSGCVHPSWHTLGTTGVWSSGVRSRLRGGLVFSLPGRTIHLPVELRGLPLPRFAPDHLDRPPRHRHRHRGRRTNNPVKHSHASRTKSRCSRMRCRLEQMCTLEGNKVYSTKCSRFRSSPTDISYCTL